MLPLAYKPQRDLLPTSSPHSTARRKHRSRLRQPSKCSHRPRGADIGCHRCTQNAPVPTAQQGSGVLLTSYRGKQLLEPSEALAAATLPGAWESRVPSGVGAVLAPMTGSDARAFPARSPSPSAQTRSRCSRRGSGGGVGVLGQDRHNEHPGAGDELGREDVAMDAAKRVLAVASARRGLRNPRPRRSGDCRTGGSERT